jgi:hypothetical protein
VIYVDYIEGSPEIKSSIFQSKIISYTSALNYVDRK